MLIFNKKLTEVFLLVKIQANAKEKLKSDLRDKDHLEESLLMTN